MSPLDDRSDDSPDGAASSAQARPGEHESAPFESWDRPRGDWLLPGRCRDPRRRTLMLEMATRALFPTILVFSLYLLLRRPLRARRRVLGGPGRGARVRPALHRRRFDGPGRRSCGSARRC